MMFSPNPIKTIRQNTCFKRALSVTGDRNKTKMGLVVKKNLSSGFPKSLDTNRVV